MFPAYVSPPIYPLLETLFCYRQSLHLPLSLQLPPAYYNYYTPKQHVNHQAR